MYFSPTRKKKLGFWPIYLKILSSRHKTALLCVYNFVWVKDSDFLLSDKNTIMINVLLIFFFYTRMFNHNIVATDKKKTWHFSSFYRFFLFTFLTLYTSVCLSLTKSTSFLLAFGFRSRSGLFFRSLIWVYDNLLSNSQFSQGFSAFPLRKLWSNDSSGGL